MSIYAFMRDPVSEAIRIRTEVDAFGRAIAALLGIALALPIVAIGQTLVIAPLARSPSAVAARPSADPSPSPPPTRDYSVTERQDAPLQTHLGWGGFATTRGHSMDFAGPWRWREDPSARPGATEVGFGLRQERWSAMVGYVQPDYAARADDSPRPRPKAVVGFSLTIHSDAGRGSKP